MTNNEAIQIIRLLGYISEHDGTIDAEVIQDAVRMATDALKEAERASS